MIASIARLLPVRWLAAWLLGGLVLPLAAQERLILPPWRELTLELPPALIVKAKVRMVADPQAQPRLIERPRALPPATARLFHLSVETRLKWFLSTKTWLGELWLQPDLTALQRTRLKSGKKRNYKIYRYGEHGVYRIRHKPGKPDGLPQDWPIDNERFYPYPPAVATHCQAISDPYALLLLLSQAQLPDTPLCVFNKNNVYEVTLQRQGSKPLTVAYQRDGDQVRATVTADHLMIRPRPLGTTGYPIEAFEFLGMEGTIEVLRDPSTRLPLQFEGEVPGFGRAKLRLTRVRRR